MIRKKIILFSILILTACKISFKEKDLISYNVYNVHDTLVFKNNFGRIKKFAIISKTIINKGWDENTRWYNPQVAYIKYKDFSKPDSIYYDNSFLTIYQETRDKIEETIYFNGFIGSIDRNAQKIKEIISIYCVPTYKVPKFDMMTVRDSTDISCVYWADQIGILAYDTKDGNRWTLVK